MSTELVLLQLSLVTVGVRLNRCVTFDMLRLVLKMGFVFYLVFFFLFIGCGFIPLYTVLANNIPFVLILFKFKLTSHISLLKQLFLGLLSQKVFAENSPLILFVLFGNLDLVLEHLEPGLLSSFALFLNVFRVVGWAYRPDSRLVEVSVMGPTAGRRVGRKVSLSLGLACGPDGSFLLVHRQVAGRGQWGFGRLT